MPTDHDRGDFDDAMRQQPSEEKHALAAVDVIEGDRAEDDSVVEKQYDAAEAEGHAEGDGHQGDLSVMSHQLSGEAALVTGELTALQLLFAGDALGGRDAQLGERH